MNLARVGRQLSPTDLAVVPMFALKIIASSALGPFPSGSPGQVIQVTLNAPGRHNALNAAAAVAVATERALMMVQSCAHWKASRAPAVALISLANTR
ncbi:hypothetical protein ACLK2E_00515 [Escherichia coli]